MRYLARDGQHDIEIVLNGKPVRGRVEPRLLLSDFLRQHLGATGTHVGCEHGVCGACTLRLDGKSVRACLIFAAQADGARIDTVEGLADSDGRLNRLQQAFRENHALQCGFCTPGILMSLSQLIENEPAADEARVREVLSLHVTPRTDAPGAVDVAARVLASSEEELELELGLDLR